MSFYGNPRLNMVEEFIDKFPGMCPICSYNRNCRCYGVFMPLPQHQCVSGRQKEKEQQNNREAK